MQLETAQRLIGGTAPTQSVVTVWSISEAGDPPGRFLLNENENYTTNGDSVPIQ